MRRLLIVMLAALAAFGLAGSPASAQDGEEAAAPVDVLQVNGLFDDIVVAEIGDAIDRADEQGSQALILQIDSRGAVVSDSVMADLFDARRRRSGRRSASGSARAAPVSTVRRHNSSPSPT